MYIFTPRRGTTCYTALHVVYDCVAVRGSCVLCSNVHKSILPQAQNYIPCLIMATVRQEHTHTQYGGWKIIWMITDKSHHSIQHTGA